MEACQTGAAEGVKGRAEKLLSIFQSDLFQALLGNKHTLHTLPFIHWSSGLAWQESEVKVQILISTKTRLKCCAEPPGYDTERWLTCETSSAGAGPTPDQNI